MDLTDSYRRVPVRVSTGRCLRFAVDGVVYTFKALPFGLNTAPWEFTRIMDAVMITVRIAYFITISNYLDDILIKNLNKDILLRGLIFYTHLNKVFSSRKEKDSITSIVNEVMTCSHSSPRILAKLVGSLQAATDAVPLGKLLLRPVQWAVKALVPHPVEYWDCRLLLYTELKSAISTWKDTALLSSGAPLGFLPRQRCFVRMQVQ